MKLNDRIKRIATLLHQVRAEMNDDIIAADIPRDGTPRIHMSRRINLDDPDNIWNTRYFQNLYPEAVTTVCCGGDYNRIAVTVDGVEVFLLEGKHETK